MSLDLFPNNIGDTTAQYLAETIQYDKVLTYSSFFLEHTKLL